MTLREEVQKWVQWILDCEESDSFFAVTRQILNRIWLAVTYKNEYKEEINRNSDFFIVGEIFGNYIYNNPELISECFEEIILEQIRKDIDLFDTFKLMYASTFFDSMDSLPKSNNTDFIGKMIDFCKFEEDEKNDIRIFEAMKMLKDVCL